MEKLLPNALWLLYIKKSTRATVVFLANRLDSDGCRGGGKFTLLFCNSFYAIMILDNDAQTGGLLSMRPVIQKTKFPKSTLTAKTGRLNSAGKVFRNWQLYLMVLPAVVYIICFAYFPMYGVQIAFRNFNFKGGITGSPWVGIANFKRLFSSYWFPIILKNTLTLSALSLVLSFPLPIIFALMANEVQHEKLKRTLQTVS